MSLCDVTLREGSQMPGRSYSVEQKVAAGQELAELGVATIQPGFPATGPDDREAIARLAESTTSEICAIARAIEDDIDAALSAQADIVQIFAPVSDLQLEHVLGKSRFELVELVTDSVMHATDRGATVQFGLMDGFRTPPERIAELYDAVPETSRYLLADTVGSRTPSEVTDYLNAVRSNGVELSDLGVHFHDDLGLATANALAALRMGVGQVDVSIASLGERAGNTALEELVVASVMERDDPLGIDLERLVPTCTEVLEILDEAIPPRKPILGGEVFSHESGIHTSTMLSAPETFEPFDPADFGGRRRLVFGEGTGRGAARALLEQLDRTPTEERIEELLTRFASEGPMELEEAQELAKRV